MFRWILKIKFLESESLYSFLSFPGGTRGLILTVISRCSVFGIEQTPPRVTWRSRHGISLLRGNSCNFYERPILNSNPSPI